MRLETSAESIRAATDEELVIRLREIPDSPCAPDLSRELFQRHYHKVAAWCFRFTGERESAMDLAQEVFIKAFRRLDAFRGESRFSTWLYTIARNHCITAVKNWATEPAHGGHGVPAHLADERSASIQDTLEREEMLDLMRRIVSESLDEIELQVMVLHYSEEIPLEIITRLLNLTNRSGAKAYIVSARRKLTAAVRSLNLRKVHAA